MLKVLVTWVFLFPAKYCQSIYSASLRDVGESQLALPMVDGF